MPAVPGPSDPTVARAVRAGRARHRADVLVDVVLCVAATCVALAWVGPPPLLTAAVLAPMAVLTLVGLRAGEVTYRRTHDRAPADLVERVGALAARAGVAPPHVRVHTGRPVGRQSRRLAALWTFNACAADDLTPGSTILVGSRLLAALHRDEEDAILGHEVGHVAHGSAPRTVLRHLAHVLWAVALRLALLWTVFAPVGAGTRWAHLGALLGAGVAVSEVGKALLRSEEHAADRTGAALIGSPVVAASAQLRLGVLHPPVTRAISRAVLTGAPVTAALAGTGLLVEPPAPMTEREIRAAHAALPTRRSRSTHPSTRARVSRLLAL